jgi:hypothetical protein
MYTFIREITFRTMVDAVRGAPISQSVARLYKEAHGLDVSLMRPIAGSPLRLRFVSQMASMDAWREVQMKAMQDLAMQKLLAEIAPLVDGSKTYDDIWQ